MLTTSTLVLPWILVLLLAVLLLLQLWRSSIGPGSTSDLTGWDSSACLGSTGHKDSSTGAWCSFGSVTGYWSNDSNSNRHWFIFEPHCQLEDLLPAFSEAASQAGIAATQAARDPTLPLPLPAQRSTPISGSPVSNISGKPIARQRHARRLRNTQQAQHGGQPKLHLPARLTDSLHLASSAGGQAADLNQATAQQPSQAAAQHPSAPTQAQIDPGADLGRQLAVAVSSASARIMFLSDSVDRYILTYLCGLAGGQVRGADKDQGGR